MGSRRASRRHLRIDRGEGCAWATTSTSCRNFVPAPARVRCRCPTTSLHITWPSLHSPAPRARGLGVHGIIRMRGRAASLQARAPLGTHGHLVGSGIGHHSVVAPAHWHRPWRRAEGRVQLSDTGQTSNTCYAEEGRLPGAHSRPAAHHRQAPRAAHHTRELIHRIYKCGFLKIFVREREWEEKDREGYGTFRTQGMVGKTESVRVQARPISAPNLNQRTNERWVSLPLSAD